MNQEGAHRYTELMWDAKRRSELINRVLANEINLVYEISKVEFIYLQFRLILEHLALGSLVANPAVLQQVQSKWGQYRNAKELAKEIRTHNPNYYPKPIQISTETKFKWDDVEERTYLTEDRFMTLYDICSNQVLHTNSLRQKRGQEHYPKLARKAATWHKWIHSLLNKHLVYPADMSGLWLIQMGQGFDTRPTAQPFGKWL